MNKDKEVDYFDGISFAPTLLGKKKQKQHKFLYWEEQTKYEIAQELGILDKVLEGGWKSLSAKETGRIGGIMARKKPKK